MQGQLMKRQERESFLGLWDWVLVIGTVIAPMNELRFWRIGPGEILLLLWCARYIGRLFTLRFSNTFLKFWMLFLPCISIGCAYCVLFYPEESDPAGLITFALFAFVSICIEEGIKDNSSERIRNIIFMIAVVTAFWYMFLYVYSMNVRARFLGASLWYKNVRFSGGANNPHQIAPLLCVSLFINLIHFLKRDVSVFRRLIAGVSMFCCGFVSLKTKSSTLVVAVVVSAAFFAYYLCLQNLKTKSQKWVATSVLIIAFAIVLGLFQEKLYDYMFEWVESDANGLGRFEIFFSIGDTLRKAWLTGLGPGTHALNGTLEYHNSYLEFLATGGVIGLTLFFLFTARIFRHISVDRIMWFCVIPLYAYGLGGFSTRRMTFWVITALVTGYALQLRKEQESDGRKSLQAMDARQKAAAEYRGT